MGAPRVDESCPASLQQGKTAEARGLLEPVYSWFSEGLDTTDLNETAAYLESRSGNRKGRLPDCNFSSSR